MKRKLLIFALTAFMVFSKEGIADEGMWMVNMFESIYPQMVKKGLKLKPGEIYNEERAAIADAIVSLDFGCTGSMISAEGLMITNHHCAYGDIHSLSTGESNYLENGFWAMNRSQEKHIKGKSALFLRKVTDITDEVKETVKQVKSSGFRGMLMRRVYRIVENKHKENTPYEVMCASVWGGTKYYMFYYESYPDVRLVGAPPVSIGAFGGETDNWGWPQHKGDFALYRIYAGKDGRPAEYSPENVPLVPAKVLDISVSGVKDGDYAMILGYPARTHRYVSSFEVKQKQEIINPIVIRARRGKLNIWARHMNESPAIRLMYADKYFGISNYADYAKWENKCFKMYNVKGIREAEERGFDGRDKAMLDSIGRGYEAVNDMVKYKTWFRECFVTASEWFITVKRLSSVVRNMEKNNTLSVTSGDSLVKRALEAAGRSFSGFDKDADMELFKFNLGLFIENVPDKYFSDTLKSWIKKFEGSAGLIAEYVYNNSDFSSMEKMERFFSVPRTAEEIKNDPVFKLGDACNIEVFNALEKRICKKLGYDPGDYRNVYVKRLYKNRKGRGIPQAPDANSTMRITYGTVGGIAPYDGVSYGYRTSIKGYLEKENPADYEFNVNEKMKSLIASGDWGRWGEAGNLYVNFLTNNDITGGNSGSPVLNGKGNIIGLAFDGNRESISGDAYYHPSNFKTVCVDIRFVLWVIEKYAGDGYLLNEMRLVK